MADLLMAFHGAGPAWLATGENMAKQFHLDKAEVVPHGVDLHLPDSPREGSILGAGWPVTSALDERFVNAAQGFDRVMGIGYSSGGFFLADLQLRTGIFDALCIVSAGVFAPHAWKLQYQSPPWMFVHGSRDKVVPIYGGVSPTGHRRQDLRPYFGGLDALKIMYGGESMDEPSRLDFVDPSEDGPLAGYVWGERFRGQDSYAYRWMVDEDSSEEVPSVFVEVDTWGHVDYVGRRASRIMVDWLRTGRLPS